MSVLPWLVTATIILLLVVIGLCIVIILWQGKRINELENDCEIFFDALLQAKWDSLPKRKLPWEEADWWKE
jgi:hypothetical protein